MYTLFRDTLEVLVVISCLQGGLLSAILWDKLLYKINIINRYTLEYDNNSVQAPKIMEVW